MDTANFLGRGLRFGDRPYLGGLVLGEAWGHLGKPKKRKENFLLFCLLVWKKLSGLRRFIRLPNSLKLQPGHSIVDWLGF